MAKGQTKKVAKNKTAIAKTSKFITSYFDLNKKYDLNFTDNNFGFTWEIFKEFVGDEWALFYTSTCFYKWAPTARKTSKTWGWLAFELWLVCNFSDTSVLEIRRYENTHPDTTIADLENVCWTLNDKYGLDFGPNNENGIVWKMSKEGGVITFPGGQKIDFIGYSNGNRIFGKAAKGSSYLTARTDEIILADERETLTDQQLENRYTRLMDSIFRSNRIKVSDRPIKEFGWTFIDNNELSPTYGQKITRYFHKFFALVFTCNPYDKNHHFYKTFVTPYLPLNDTVKNSLDKTGNVWYENNDYQDDLGLFIQRFTVKPFWDKLPAVAKKLLLRLKVTNPAEYDTVFKGYDYEGDNLLQFPYRQAIKKINDYDLEEFRDKKTNKYQFDFYSIGLDWATGDTDYSVAIVIGFKAIKLTGFYAPYIICELAAAPNDFFDENDKIAQFIEEFSAINDNFINFDSAIYWYDHNAETAISVIKKGLADKYDLFIDKRKAIKHASNVNRDASLANRVVWLRSVFTSGYLHAKVPKVLFEQLEELRYSTTNTNIPDPKMLQDAVDALFYALYPYNSIIPNKNNALERKPLLIGV